jgi:hypothetical protein
VTDLDALLRELARDVEFPPTPRIAGPVVGRIQAARRRQRRLAATAAVCLVAIGSALAFVDPTTLSPGADWSAAVSAEGGLPPKQNPLPSAARASESPAPEHHQSVTKGACRPDRSCP